VHGVLPGHGVSGWVQLLFSIPVVLWAAWPFFVRGWKSLVSRSLNMYTLIASRYGRRLRIQRRGVLPPRPLSGGVPRASGEVGLYFEAAAVISVLVLLGEVLQLARRRTRAGRSRPAQASRRRRQSAALRRQRRRSALDQVRRGDG